MFKFSIPIFQDVPKSLERFCISYCLKLLLEIQILKNCEPKTLFTNFRVKLFIFEVKKSTEVIKSIQSLFPQEAWKDIGLSKEMKIMRRPDSSDPKIQRYFPNYQFSLNLTITYQDPSILIVGPWDRCRITNPRFHDYNQLHHPFVHTWMG